MVRVEKKIELRTEDFNIRLNEKAQEKRRSTSTTAARVAKEIKCYAKKRMGTCDVRIDPFLSKIILIKGFGGALDMKIRMSVKKSTSILEMGNRPLYYTLVTYVNTPPEEQRQEQIAKKAKIQTGIPQRMLHTVSESELAEDKSSDGA
uniref:60S ribosomal protein L31 n=1 Tax=Paracalanus parvus TaxID=187406 RepID=A0A0U2UQ96_9MAXI|nr:60S ribosomal protein L31 [Paracalanus parvus]